MIPAGIGVAVAAWLTVLVWQVRRYWMPQQIPPPEPVFVPQLAIESKTTAVALGVHAVSVPAGRTLHH